MFKNLFRRRAASEVLPHSASADPAESTQHAQNEPGAVSEGDRQSSESDLNQALMELANRAQRLLDEDQAVAAMRLLAPHSERYSAEPAFLAVYGVALYMTSRYAESIRALDAVLSHDPSHVDSLKFLVGAYYQTAQYREGIKAAERAIVAGSADEQVYNALGAMFLNVGEIEASLEAFAAAVKLNPANLQALANLEAVRARFSAVGLSESDPDEIRRIRESAIASLIDQLRRESLTIEQADQLSQMIGSRQDTWPVAQQLVDVFGHRADLTANLAANLANSCFYAGRNDDSQRLSALAFAMAPHTTEIRNGRGYRLVRAGQTSWQDGWRMMADTNRLLNPNNYPDSVAPWRGEQLNGQKLFVHFDQGVGDALMALRFLDILSARAIKVVLWVLPAMADLITQVPPGVELVRAEFMPDPQLIGCAFACGLFDLVAALGLQPSDIGVFTTLPAPSAASPLPTTSKRRTLALIAMGNPKRADDWFRSLKSTDLTALAALPDVRWVNLAVDRRADLDRAIELLEMHDPTRELKTFAATASVLAQVDGVIAIDCATAHLAGALRRPLWILKPTMEDWRWQIGDSVSPWWPDARVFQADAPGQWTRAVAELAADVAAWRN